MRYLLLLFVFAIQPIYATNNSTLTDELEVATNAVNEKPKTSEEELAASVFTRDGTHVTINVSIPLSE